MTGLEEDVSCETGDWTAERTGEKHYEGLNSLRLDLSPVTGGLTYVSDFDLQFFAVDVSGSKKWWPISTMIRTPFCNRRSRWWTHGANLPETKPSPTFIPESGIK